MYKIMIHIDTHTNDTWFYYQEEGKDYVANSLEEIRETVLTLIDVYGEDYIKIVKQETGDDMNGSVETFLYDSTDNYEELVNRPFINGVEIVGALSLAELGIQPVGNYATNERVDVLEETVDNIDLSPYATNARVDQVEYKVDNIDLTPYATNERVEQVEAKVDAIDLEPYATMDYLDEVVAGIDFSASNENITGVKTFSVLPRSTVMPVTEDELTNKSYVDHGVENCASKEYVDGLLANIDVNVVKQLPEEIVIINDYESGIYQPTYNGAKVRLYNENRTAYTEPTNMTNSMLIWDREKRTFLAIFQSNISLYSYYGATSESYAFGKNVMFTFKDQEITGKKTFTTLPETSIVPTLANQLVNKAYVDNLANQNKGIQVLTANVNKHLDNGIYLIDKDNLTINAAASTSVSYKYGTMVFKDLVYINGMHFHIYAALDYDSTNGPQLKISYVAAGSYRFTNIYVPFSKLATMSYVDNAIANIDVPDVDLTDYYTKTEVDKAISEVQLSGEVMAEMSVFSTDEQVIGTWTNGKPLYRKVLSTFEVMSENVNLVVPHGVTGIEKIWIDFGNSYYHRANDKRTLTLVQTFYTTTSSTDRTSAYADDTNVYLISTGGWNDAWEKVITIQYTKEADEPTELRYYPITQEAIDASIAAAIGNVLEGGY